MKYMRNETVGIKVLILVEAGFPAFEMVVVTIVSSGGNDLIPPSDAGK